VNDYFLTRNDVFDFRKLKNDARGICPQRLARQTKLRRRFHLGNHLPDGERLLMFFQERDVK